MRVCKHAYDQTAHGIINVLLHLADLVVTGIAPVVHLLRENVGEVLIHGKRHRRLRRLSAIRGEEAILDL